MLNIKIIFWYKRGADALVSKNPLFTGSHSSSEYDGGDQALTREYSELLHVVNRPRFDTKVRHAASLFSMSNILLYTFPILLLLTALEPLLRSRGFGRRIDARSPVHLTRPFFNGPPNHYPPDMMRSSDFEDSDGPGAATVFVIRHAERLDRADPSWSSKALRPQDTPLSETGKHQAKRLGKWLYGRLPTRAPLAIFCSPFIRCVQTADAIASELEGLQRSGLHTASATKICIEPGLMEDMTFMEHLRQHEPYV